MTENKKKELITEVLDNLYDSSLVCVWNDYCDSVNYCDDKVYCMNELDELCGNESLTSFLNNLDIGNFDLNDDYFYFSIWGLRSLSDIYDVIQIDEMVDYIIDTDETFDLDIDDILES